MKELTQAFLLITFLSMSITHLIMVLFFIKMRTQYGEIVKLMSSPDFRGGFTTVRIDFSPDPLSTGSDTSKVSEKEESSGEPHK